MKLSVNNYAICTHLGGHLLMWLYKQFHLLADRSNGCAYAIGSVVPVCLSVVCSVCTVVNQVRLTEKLSEEANRKCPMANRMVTWPMTHQD